MSTGKQLSFLVCVSICVLGWLCVVRVSAQKRSFTIDYVYDTFMKDGRPFRYGLFNSREFIPLEIFPSWEFLEVQNTKMYYEINWEKFQ